MGTQARLWLHGRRQAGVAQRDRLLEDVADAAARGVFERLFGLGGEAIVLETVKRGTARVDKVREQVCQRALTERRTQAKPSPNPSPSPEPNPSPKP